MVYGYCRISTAKQSIERQERNIKAAFPGAVILKEVYTGTKQDRPEWGKLLKTVKADDTIVFDSVSRMSRNADDGFRVYRELYEKGVNLVFLKEPQVNTDTYKAAAGTTMTAPTTGDALSDECLSGIMTALNRYIVGLQERQIRLAFEQSEKEVDDLHSRTSEGLITAKLNGKKVGRTQGDTLNVKKKAPAIELIKKHSRDFAGTLSDAECMKLIGIARNTFYKYKSEAREE